ncbi:MAG: hypothetical protein NZ957_01425 [Thaumarchaeota archaeon]|nr:hypothetical protein [Candidatus Calditenuaceae archaeon]MDW8042399.1 hypothetical protein [Nitrososphaerota archaeon]
MLLPSEIEARWLLPTLRALVVRRLVMEYGLTQEKTAYLLGITQASVSNYLRAVRGKCCYAGLKLPALERHADAIATVAYDSQDPHKVVKAIQEAIGRIRQDRTLCEIHKYLEPELDVENCDICGTFH